MSFFETRCICYFFGVYIGFAMAYLSSLGHECRLIFSFNWQVICRQILLM